VTNGLRILYGDQGDFDGGDLFDTTVPPGAYDPVARVGWIARNGSFTWLNRAGTTDLNKIVLKAVASMPGQYKVQIRGKDGSYAGNPGNLPVHAIVAIDRPFAATGQCGEWRFPATPPARPSCVANATGTMVKCH
jgi:hypothetical protein